MPPPDDDPLAPAALTTDRDASCLDPTPMTGEYPDGVLSNPSPVPATVHRAPPPGGAPVSAHPAVDLPGPPPWGKFYRLRFNRRRYKRRIR